MDNNNEKIQAAPDASKQRKRAGVLKGFKAWAPTKNQMFASALALLAISNVFSWVELVRSNNSPEIVTVGIRQLTTEYMAELAISQMSPEEVAVRTELFLSVTQDTLRRATEGQNVLLIAREAVLAGDASDVTAEVKAAVQEAMKAAAAKPAATASANPLAGSLLGQTSPSPAAAPVLGG